MSQANHPPEPSPVGRNADRSRQDDVPTGPQVPPLVNPAPPAPPQLIDPPAVPKQFVRPVKPGGPVPPPPPPRSTLVPVRPVASSATNGTMNGAMNDPMNGLNSGTNVNATGTVGSFDPSARVIPPFNPPNNPPNNPLANPLANGIGSAKTGRWRGEIGPINETSNDEHDPASGNTLGSKDRVSRSAPSWLVSMVIHLIVLLLLALLTTPAGSRLGRIVLNIGQSERVDAPELAEFSISPDDSAIEADMPAEIFQTAELPSVLETISLAPAEAPTPVSIGVGPQIASDVKPMFGGRSGAMKDALLKLYGGTPETQDAVERGLRWLKRNQLKRGGWSMKGPYSDGSHSENEAAATAMALLAFLGDGHTHKSGDYQKEVEKGMKALIRMQDRSGFFAGSARSHERMYAQAQATIAICEMYAMTKDSWLRPYAQSAIDFAQDSQSPQGGWRYEPNSDSDTSVTGWFVMGLESGKTAGLDVSGSVFYSVDKYLDSASHFDKAAYSYQPNGSPTAPMTAEGLLCRQYLGWQKDNPALLLGMDALLENDPFDIKQRDVYYWYYATQVLHHFGGKRWQQWNASMRKELPDAQITTGREDGSWAPQMDEYGNFYGRIYTTCLSIYCLEVYYRHMPLYQAN